MRFHTSLPVSDIDRAVAFYRVLFDSEPVKTKADYAKFLPPESGLNISFHHNPEGVAEVRAVHIGLEMPDQAALDRAHDRLEAGGLVSIRRDTSTCCYASQDKFWITDPDGYEWELYVLLEDTEERVGKNTTCCTFATDAPGGATAGGCG